MVPHRKMGILRPQFWRPTIRPQRCTRVIDKRKLILGFQVHHCDVGVSWLIGKGKRRREWIPGVGTRFSFTVGDRRGLQRDVIFRLLPWLQQDCWLGKTVMLVGTADSP